MKLKIRKISVTQDFMLLVKISRQAFITQIYVHSERCKRNKE